MELGGQSIFKMKFLKCYFALGILLSIAFTGCKKDDDPKDPCEGITCLNGGHCVNGQCLCAEGYTGADCSQQATPSKVRITKVEVTKFPATDNGADWDDFLEGPAEPDIYPMLVEGTSIIWNCPSYIPNASQSIYSFTPDVPIDLNPTTQYTIHLYDYDTVTDDDFIEGVTFTPYHSLNGFPITRTLDAGGRVAFKIYMTYVH